MSAPHRVVCCVYLIQIRIPIAKYNIMSKGPYTLICNVYLEVLLPIIIFEVFYTSEFDDTFLQ